MGTHEGVPFVQMLLNIAKKVYENDEYVLSALIYFIICCTKYTYCYSFINFSSFFPLLFVILFGAADLTSRRILAALQPW
jgi:hypothetical protein